MRHLAATALLLAGCAAPSPWQWESQPGRSLALQRQGATVWRFCYDDGHGKPCFHPLALPAGELTVDGPRDHPWHHGLWFSWKLIDGVNCWEHDRATGRPVGRTTWQPPQLEPHDDGSARIRLTLAYVLPPDRTVLREERIVVVGAPAADGTFALDWQSEFTAVQDCVLDRTPPPGQPGGAANGGYAGLSLRLVELDQRAAVTPDGPVEFDRNDRFHGQAAAMDYGGLLHGRPVGIAVLDHPQNPRTPSPWYAIRAKAMTFFTPAVLCAAPLRLAAGTGFVLRYRVVVHAGRWDPDRLRAEAARYAGTVTPEGDHR